MSSEFLSAAVSGINVLRNALDKSRSQAETDIEDVLREVTAQMPLPAAHAREARERLADLLTSQTTSLCAARISTDDNTQTTAHEMLAYRELLNVISIHDNRERAAEDAALPFWMTMLPREHGMTNLPRGDIGAAMLTTELSIVMAASESELMSIARKREAHNRDAADTLAAANRNTAAAVQQSADVRKPSQMPEKTGPLALPPASTLRNPRFVMAALHCGAQTTSDEQALRAIPRLQNAVDPLLKMSEFDAGALRAVSYTLARDSNLQARLASFHEFESAVSAHAPQYFQRLPRLVEYMAREERPTAALRSRTLNKIGAVLSALIYILRLLYAASVAGTIDVALPAAAGYETTEWHTLRENFIALANAIDTKLSALTRAGRIETFDIMYAGAVTNNEPESESTFTGLPVGVKEFYVSLVAASNAGVKTIRHLLARAACHLAITGVLASHRTALRPDGIDPFVFADTLHGALDVDAALALDYALPLLASQQFILFTPAPSSAAS